jgi:inorganic pyrophosphatase
MGTFFDELDRLHTMSSVIIDRPAGSTHPRFLTVRYPIDDGNLEGTRGGDGEGVDLFVGSAHGVRVVAAAVTVDLARRDAEVKILADCSSVEVERIAEFLTNTLGLGAHLFRREGSRAHELRR